MSELMFRAWDIDWHRFEYFEIGENGDRYGIFRVAANKFGSVVEQYTGLKDENGKEIYEGDILESTWNGDRAVVVWNDVEGEWEHYADFNTHSKYSGSVIIGNIHENPELLEEEK